MFGNVINLKWIFLAFSRHWTNFRERLTTFLKNLNCVSNIYGFSIMPKRDKINPKKIQGQRDLKPEKREFKSCQMPKSGLASQWPKLLWTKSFAVVAVSCHNKTTASTFVSQKPSNSSLLFTLLISMELYY